MWKLWAFCFSRKLVRLRRDFNTHAFGQCVNISGEKVTAPLSAIVPVELSKRSSSKLYQKATCIKKGGYDLEFFSLFLVFMNVLMWLNSHNMKFLKFRLNHTAEETMLRSKIRRKQKCIQAIDKWWINAPDREAWRRFFLDAVRSC